MQVNPADILDDIISTLQTSSDTPKTVEEPKAKSIEKKQIIYSWIDENEECAMVEPSEHYTMVTSTVAIGNVSSPYEPFDIVVDLAFRQQFDLKPMEILKEQTEDKLIYRIGLMDMPSEPIGQLFTTVIPELLQRTKEQPDVKILFHCQMGISRSSSMAIAYLAQLLNQSYEEVLDNIKKRRSIVQPNEGFSKALQSYLEAIPK